MRRCRSKPPSPRVPTVIPAKAGIQRGPGGAQRTQGMLGGAGRRCRPAKTPPPPRTHSVNPNQPRSAKQNALPLTYEVRQLPVWPEIQQRRLESRGSRRKFWISIEGETNLWLLKFPRPNTGEHWAEKIAAEVGALIGVDCARVELADCGGELVTVCESFDPEIWYEQYEYDYDPSDWLDEELIVVGDIASTLQMDSTSDGDYIFFAGCDVLSWNNNRYDVEARFGQRDHNVGNIVRAIKEMFQDLRNPGLAQIDGIFHSLASYAVLDGLIGNTDRHHENWMLKIELKDDFGWMSAVPSYDHASSLGRELKDERRTRYLDSGGVLNYVKRGHGGVYGDDGHNRAPSPLETANYISQRWPEYTQPTLQRIGELPDSEIRTAIDRVPTEFMGDIAKEFAYQIIVTSKTELSKLIR